MPRKTPKSPTLDDEARHEAEAARPPGMQPMSRASLGYRMLSIAGVTLEADPSAGLWIRVPGEFFSPELRGVEYRTRVVEHDGSFVLTELHVTPATPAPRIGKARDPITWDGQSPLPRGGLHSKHLRAVRIGDLMKIAEIAGPFHLRQVEPAHHPDLADVLQAARRQRRVGRRGNPDALYAKVARAYVEALASGNRQPTARLARELGYSHHYIRDLVKEARNRGLLTHPSSRGRAGGSLTQKALTLLSQDSRMEEP